MKNFNRKSIISEAATPCFATKAIKGNRNVLDAVNGTSAVIADFEPEGN